MGSLLTREYEIRFYESDYLKRVTVPVLLRLCDDVAVFQSEHLGSGVDDLKKKNMAWMMNLWNIEFFDLPVYRETVKVSTVALGSKKFYAFRNYKIHGADGRLCFQANSRWILFDLEHGRPMRMPPELMESYDSHPEDFVPEMVPPKDPERVDFEAAYRARYSDLDQNGHVNNTNYLGWAFDALPEDFIEKHRPVKLRLEYKKEGRCGDEIRVLSQLEKELNLVRVMQRVMLSTGETLALAESEWILS